MNRIDLKQLAGYDEDFALWSAEQAELIRKGKLDRVDIENVAEELEGLGRQEKRLIESYLQSIAMQMLRWHYQPEYRCGKWQSTLLEYRSRLDDLLEHSPSLVSHPAAVLQEEYVIAREWIAIETSVYLDLIPTECPWSIDKVLDPDFLPD